MKYLLVIDYSPPSILKAVIELRKNPAFKDLAAAVLTKTPEKYAGPQKKHSFVKVIACSFKSSEEIGRSLKPVREQISGVACRQDKSIQLLRKVLPYLQENMPVASELALNACTNKRLMRELFSKHCPEISPRYVKVKKADPAAASALSYPVIVKPANLASSLLIQACRTPAELKKSLVSIFRHIKEVYKREDRSDPAEVIIEEFLDGDFYSIDAYVAGKDEVTYCPAVGYIPSNKIGIDDFSLYKRFVPSSLSAKEESAAQAATRKAIDAVGLTYSSAHVELVLTKSGWKIIEIGPRIGRFRNAMYRLGYGINHADNDVRLHLGLEPEVKNGLLQYCSAYSIYPKQEGALVKLHGLKELRSKEGIYKLKVHATRGDECKFAKNGGKALLEFIVAHSDKKYYNKLINFVESQVWAETDNTTTAI